MFPSAPQHQFQALIPDANHDGNNNNTGIFKLRYQHNFSSNAYLRAYAVTCYYDYVATGPMSAALYYAILGRPTTTSTATTTARTFRSPISSTRTTCFGSSVVRDLGQRLRQ